jgi:hypothetical protein
VSHLPFSDLWLPLVTKFGSNREIWLPLEPLWHFRGLFLSSLWRYWVSYGAFCFPWGSIWTRVAPLFPRSAYVVCHSFGRTTNTRTRQLPRKPTNLHVMFVFPFDFSKSVVLLFRVSFHQQPPLGIFLLAKCIFRTQIVKTSTSIINYTSLHHDTLLPQPPSRWLAGRFFLLLRSVKLAPSHLHLGPSSAPPGYADLHCFPVAFGAAGAGRATTPQFAVLSTWGPSSRSNYLQLVRGFACVGRNLGTTQLGAHLLFVSACIYNNLRLSSVCQSRLALILLSFLRRLELICCVDSSSFLRPKGGA